MSNESDKVDQPDSLVRPYRRPEYSLKRNCQCNQSKVCLRCLIFDNNNKKGAGIVIFIKYSIDIVLIMKKSRQGNIWRRLMVLLLSIASWKHGNVGLPIGKLSEMLE